MRLYEERLIADKTRQKTGVVETETATGEEQLKDLNGNEHQDSVNINNIENIQENKLIPPILLLEERLIANIDRRKVGEVVVRKKVETEIIEIPIRREKLIVEQVSPEYKQIAVIDLGTDRSSYIPVNEEVSLNYSQPVVKSEFESIKLASQFLNAIAHLSDAGCTSIKIEIKVKDISVQKAYQELLGNFLNESQ